MMQRQPTANLKAGCKARPSRSSGNGKRHVTREGEQHAVSGNGVLAGSGGGRRADAALGGERAGLRAVHP